MTPAGRRCKKNSEHSQRVSASHRRKRERLKKLSLIKYAQDLTLEDYQSSDYYNAPLQVLIDKQSELATVTDFCLHLYGILTSNEAPDTLKEKTLMDFLRRTEGDEYNFFNYHILPHVARYLDDMDLNYFFIEVVLRRDFSFNQRQEIANNLVRNRQFTKSHYLNCLFASELLQVNNEDDKIGYILSLLVCDNEKKRDMISYALAKTDHNEKYQTALISHARTCFLTEEENGLYPDSWVPKYLAMQSRVKI